MSDRQAAIEALLDRYERPTHRGMLAGPVTATGHAENPRCGDVVDAHVRVANGRVDAARFEGRGCTISQALADAACEALEGKSVEEAGAIDLASVLQIVGARLAESRPDCAAVGLRALRSALEQAATR